MYEWEKQERFAPINLTLAGHEQIKLLDSIHTRLQDCFCVQYMYLLKIIYSKKKEEVESCGLFLKKNKEKVDKS